MDNFNPLQSFVLTRTLIEYMYVCDRVECLLLDKLLSRCELLIIEVDKSRGLILLLVVQKKQIAIRKNHLGRYNTATTRESFYLST